MKEFQMAGDIMSDSDAEILRYFGCRQNVCPADVRAACRDAGEEGLMLYVNSDGGSLLAGTEMFSVLREYGRASAKIQSRAASSATVAIMGCGHISADPCSLVCIHNPSARAEGDAEEMRRAAEDLEEAKTAILSAYAVRAKATAEELALRMDRDVWMSASEAFALGLVDEIEENQAEKSHAVFINAGGRAFFPTAKMAAEFRAAKERQRGEAERARLSLYR